MNIQVSYNWLKEYLPGLKASPEQVAEKLSLHSFSVEKITRMDEGMDNLVIGCIEKIEKHPNADKLRLVQCRIKNAECRIVCGGTNLYEGQLVAVALPGARVRWHGTGEPIELKETEIRGVKSAGMICSASEIGLAQAFPHQEAEILDLSWTKAKPGTKLAEVLGLDDAIMEIEITSNRPDAMGIIGLAREVGAIFNIKLKIKDKKLKTQIKNSKISGVVVEVKVEAPRLCPRYIAVVMDNIKVEQSPWWLQRRLIAAGVRPINSIVDITNYVLLEYGQPCHAFDTAKLYNANSARIIVRMAKKGEKILALDGKNYDLSENILVIADEKRPVAIAGIMGGEETGVQKDTQKIIYEVANFEPIVVRKGEHELSLNSDASIRFNKGLPVDLPQYVIGRLIELTKEISQGQVVAIIDKQAIAQKPTRVKVDPRAVQKIIGVEIPLAKMKKYLTRLGFSVSVVSKRRRPSLRDGELWQITFPYWRELEADGVEDVAEEVARMHGYYLLPSLLYGGSLVSSAPSAQFVKEQNVKQALCGAGYTELYTYSFLSKDELLAGGYDPASAVLELLNPLTSDLAYLRPWLGLTILSAVSHNQTVKEQLNLFELSHEYIPGSGAQLPQERQKLIVAVAGKEHNEGEHFFKVKGLAEHLGAVLDLPKLSFEEIAAPGKAPWVKHYHPGRVLVCKSNNDILGIVGEIHPAILSKFNIDGRVAFLEWEFSALAALIGHGRVYVSPSPYPAVKRDVSFVAPKAVKYAELVTAIGKADPLIQNVELFDKYSGADIPEDHQSLAFHISYADTSRTLISAEADQAHAKLMKMLERKFNAKIRD